MKEELTEKMHSEFSVTEEEENKLRAGCVWHVLCDRSSTKNEIERIAKMYLISYDIAMKYRDFWLDKYNK